MKLHDLFEHVENYMEAVSYRAPDSEWKIVGRNLERELTIEDEKIIVILQPQIFTYDNKTINFINLSFDGFKKDGTRTNEITGNSAHSSKVLGAATHAWKEKLKEYDYEAVTFVAIDKVDKRMSIYERLVKNNLQAYGHSYLPNVPLHNGGKAIVVFNNDGEWHKEFIEWLKKQNKL